MTPNTNQSIKTYGLTTYKKIKFTRQGETKPTLKMKATYLSLFCILIFQSCLTNMADSTIELGPSFNGSFKIHSDSTTLIKNVLYTSSGAMEIGYTEQGTDKKIGKWLMIDEHLCIKEVIWYSNGRKFMTHIPKGSKCCSSTISKDSLDINQLSSVVVTIDTNTYNSNLVRLLIHSNSFPIDYFKFNSNVYIKSFDSDATSNTSYLLIKKSSIKEDSYINVIYRYTISGDANYNGDKDNEFKTDSIPLGNYLHKIFTSENIRERDVATNPLS